MSSMFLLFEASLQFLEGGHGLDIGLEFSARPVFQF
jgi:hypothetical protein